MEDTQPGQEFDVYISFSEKDPRRHVADYASKSLVLNGIRTFKDENQVIQRGLQLGLQRKEAIQASRIAILLLSADYLSSDFCLEELVMILRCREKWGMIVVPIFYDLNPSDMRKARGVVASALARQRVGGCWWRRWKVALQEASDLCGWDRTIHPSESKFVGLIVQDIVDKRIPSNLKISIYPIGYDSLSEYLNLFLQIGSDDVLMVGIGGASERANAMVAKAVYDGTFKAFDGSSFLRGVGLKSKRSKGLVQLQQKLLSDVLLGEKINIINVIRGVNMIKERLSHKRVLIVLDDVDDLTQLYALVGSRKWFGLGSKIIITTRVIPLIRAFGVDQIFMAQGLVMPVDILEILEPYQQSCHHIAGLMECIQSFRCLTNHREQYLEDCLRRERRKAAIQAQRVLELRHGRKEDVQTASRVRETGVLVVSTMPANSSNGCYLDVVNESSRFEESV